MSTPNIAIAHKGMLDLTHIEPSVTLTYQDVENILHEYQEYFDVYVREIYLRGVHYNYILHTTPYVHGNDMYAVDYSNRRICNADKVPVGV